MVREEDGWGGGWLGRRMVWLGRRMVGEEDG